MTKFIDLTGQRFRRLVVIERVENDKWGNSRWLCQCNCENKNEIYFEALSEAGLAPQGCTPKIKDFTRGKDPSCYVGRERFCCCCVCSSQARI